MCIVHFLTAFATIYHNYIYIYKSMESGIGMCILIFTIKSPQKALQYSYDPVIVICHFLSIVPYYTLSWRLILPVPNAWKPWDVPPKSSIPPFITCQKGNDESLKRKAWTEAQSWNYFSAAKINLRNSAVIISWFWFSTEVFFTLLHTKA